MSVSKADKRKDGNSRKGSRGPQTRGSRTPKLTYWIFGVGVLAIAFIAVALHLRGRTGQGELRQMDTVKIETTKGVVVAEVYPAKMPVTVRNFEDLVKSGFYKDLLWHRVEDWVVQTGDPTGTGAGGSNHTIKLEISKDLKNIRGSLGMARSPEDPNSASSQFYILKTDAPWLDGQYAVFGKVIKGMDVIDQITSSDKVLNITLTEGTTVP